MEHRSMGRLLFRLHMKLLALWGRFIWLLIRYKILESGMPAQTEKLMSKSFLVKPFPGWGWYVEDRYLWELPAPFHFELQYLERGRKKFSSGIGLIRQKDHPLDGKWILFSPRHVGNSDLGRPHIAWNLSILKTPEQDSKPEMETLLLQPSVITGFAWIEDKKKKEKL